jgi:hypothetical protein
LNVHGYTAGFGNSGCLHKQIRKKGEGCSRLKLHTRNVFAIEEMRVVIKAFDRSIEEQIDLVGFWGVHAFGRKCRIVMRLIGWKPGETRAVGNGHKGLHSIALDKKRVYSRKCV